MYFREGNDVRLQIHVAVDPKETTPDEIRRMKEDLVHETTLAVRDIVKDKTPEDPDRLKPNSPSMKERWEYELISPLRAKVTNSANYARWLLNGNRANDADGYIHAKGDKPFRFRRRDTGEIVYTWKVRPIDPNKIFRTVPMPYSFRRDVIEYAMDHGSMHALAVMSGREEWRGVLQVRLTRL